MSTDFTYSTELDVRGPWLISRPALEELDHILQGAWESWNESKEQQIAADLATYAAERRAEGRDVDDAELERVRDSFAGYYTRDQRTARISFADGKSLRADTLRDALSALAASNEKAVAFHVAISVADQEAEVSAGGRSYRRDTISVRVTPETATQARELFGSLRQWVKKHEPPWWQRLWATVGWAPWFVWLLALSMVVVAVPTPEVSARRAAMVQADSLLVGGISSEDVPAAVELLLRIETRLVEGQVASVLPRSLIVLFWAGLLLNIVLSIRPKIVIGIGTGEDSLKRWSRWFHIVGVTIPGIIFASVIIPYLLDFVSRLLSN